MVIEEVGKLCNIQYNVVTTWPKVGGHQKATSICSRCTSQKHGHCFPVGDLIAVIIASSGKPFLHILDFSGSFGSIMLQDDV